AEHQLLPFGAAGGPGAEVLELIRVAALARHRDEELQSCLGVADDAEVGHEDPADLGGLDVHVYEPAALAVDLQRAGVPVGPAVANSEHEVAPTHGLVAS